MEWIETINIKKKIIIKVKVFLLILLFKVDDFSLNKINKLKDDLLEIDNNNNIIPNKKIKNVQLEPLKNNNINLNNNEFQNKNIKNQKCI